MNDLYEEIAQTRRRNEPVVLATVVDARGSTPGKTGAKMLVYQNGKISGTIGGGSLEHRIIKKALELVETSQPYLARFELTEDEASAEGMLCGGTMDVFLEPINPSPALLVFGGGHISFSLVKLGKMLDFRVIVIDDRPEFANTERFPDADEILVSEMGSAVKRLEIDRSSYIVIVTRGHENDAVVLKEAVATGAGYIGMIGSKRKVSAVFSELEAKGITREQLGRVHSPIGLAIGAKTPEEIAVSIMAEIIQVRRQSETEGKA